MRLGRGTGGATGGALRPVVAAGRWLPAWYGRLVLPSVLSTDRGPARHGSVPACGRNCCVPAGGYRFGGSKRPGHGRRAHLGQRGLAALPFRAADERERPRPLVPAPCCLKDRRRPDQLIVTAWQRGRPLDDRHGDRVIAGEGRHPALRRHCLAAREGARPLRAENFLFGVRTVSARNAWAVGSFTNRGSAQQSLILHWDGSSWKQQRSPNPHQCPMCSSASPHPRPATPGRWGSSSRASRPRPAGALERHVVDAGGGTGPVRRRKRTDRRGFYLARKCLGGGRFPLWRRSADPRAALLLTSTSGRRHVPVLHAAAQTPISTIAIEQGLSLLFRQACRAPFCTMQSPWRR